MAIANQIAQFGMNTGRNIQDTVGNAFTRNENQRRYDQQRKRIAKLDQAATMQKAMEREQAYAANGFRVMSQLPPEQRPAAWQQWLQTGTQQGIDMAGVPTEYNDSLLQKLAFQGGGVDRQNMPSSVSAFNAMVTGLSPEDTNKARRINLGLDPRAMSGAAKNVIIGGVNHVFDPTTKTYIPAVVNSVPVTTETVADSESSIAGAKEDAVLDSQLRTKPKIAAAVKTAEVDAERGAAKPKATAKLNSAMRKINRVVNTIDDAIGSVDWRTAGLAGSIASAVKGTPAYDLKQNVITIKANLGFDALQEMRDNSPTGGALGQVAIQELEALQASVRSLDLGQSPDQLASNLRAVRDHYRNYQNAVQSSYSAEYESNEGPKEIKTKSEYDALPSGTIYLEDGQEYRKP